jgi:hypothetical protein
MRDFQFWSHLWDIKWLPIAIDGPSVRDMWQRITSGSGSLQYADRGPCCPLCPAEGNVGGTEEQKSLENSIAKKVESSMELSTVYYSNI